MIGTGTDLDEIQEGTATVRTEIPVEFSAGIAIKALKQWTIASSFTLAAWKDTTQELESTAGFFPFSLLTPFTNQSNLTQWRIGTEYRTSPGIAIRG